MKGPTVRKCGRRPLGERGFILVLTLWILAAVAIAAAYFGERVQTSLRLASSRQRSIDAQLALADARAELLFRLSTTPLTRRGLGELPDAIRLDDRTYEDSGSLVRVQDAAGLLNLNGTADEQLIRMLGTFGVPDSDRSSLVDALRDYTDADDLRRLNGAERDQYRAIGRPDLPRNAPLVSVQELRDVYGWKQQPSLWKEGGLLDFVATSGAPPLNLNTASWQVIASLPGVTPDVARAIVARRELEPVDVGWLDRMLGTTYDTAPSPVTSFPSAIFRITQQAPGVPGGLRYNVELTARGSNFPWRITDFHRLESAPPSEGPEQRAAAPSASSPQPTANETRYPRFPPRSVQPASAPDSLVR